MHMCMHTRFTELARWRKLLGSTIAVWALSMSVSAPSSRSSTCSRCRSPEAKRKSKSAARTTARPSTRRSWWIIVRARAPCASCLLGPCARVRSSMSAETPCASSATTAGRRAAAVSSAERLACGSITLSSATHSRATRPSSKPQSAPTALTRRVFSRSSSSTSPLRSLKTSCDLAPSRSSSARKTLAVPPISRSYSLPPKARRRESGSRQPQHGGQLCPAIWQHRQPSAGAGYVGCRTGQLFPGARQVLRPSVASAETSRWR